MTEGEAVAKGGPRPDWFKRLFWMGFVSAILVVVFLIYYISNVAVEPIP